MSIDRYRFIAIEGPIGVGKTSLARKIAEVCGARALLETPQENPFLEPFYRDAARHALPAQIAFLLQRSSRWRELAVEDPRGQPVVSDFLLDKDPLFAELTLAGDELALYRQLYAALRPPAPQPDLVIYLQADTGKLIERVRKRGVPMELAISEGYLQRLCDSYSRFFHEYDAAPLLIVNNEHLNPILRDEDFNLLLTRIAQMRGKREFFKLGN
jgi:deoxyguanosine kinase